MGEVNGLAELSELDKQWAFALGPISRRYPETMERVLADVPDIILTLYDVEITELKEEEHG